MPTPVITTTEFFSKIEACTMHMAHGPDGHTHLLARRTAESALRDGLDYFLDSRVYVDGKWVIGH